MTQRAGQAGPQSLASRPGQPLLDQLRGPLAAAQAAIDSGHAAATLEAWIAATR